MLRSNINTEKSDFKKVKEKEHIEKVWTLIETNIPIYFEKMIDDSRELHKLKESDTFKIKSSAPDVRKKLSEIFEKGLSYYKKEDEKYKKFFADDSMQEFEDEDDPKAFKSALSTKVPVILKARNSKREMMHEWQRRFASSKATDVYAIFFNLITFMNEFIEEIDDVKFAEYNNYDDLERLIVLNEDDDYNVPGVIGMGIKSSVLYYLNPQFFLCANKNTLYGFYFLSSCQYFSLPSGSNEFIMINDVKEIEHRGQAKNMPIDQNYWYPYDLFMLYGLRSFRLLQRLCEKHKYKLSEEHRFVHLSTFMSQLWQMELDKINTMTGGYQDDVR
jgi:hypothetical protein